ncbi:MAG TPA: type I DNA topoisomerase [Bacteroidota bacterium]|nr:type I DNA topoisomerase [Bacteroidota bacterium]
MAKSLIIVESPAKARTINKYLGKEYTVHASVGHIKNLPKSSLGVDLENGYAPTLEVIKGKEDVVKGLRDTVKKVDNIYIATDPDREGEAIAADIAEEIGDANANIYRVLFHEITENGVNEAMKNPVKINTDLVSSQRARRVMDRIVGYKVSPFLWKTLYYGLSAGRVQSVALKLICEREMQIREFTPTEYWSIIAEFSTPKRESFYAKLMKIDGRELFVPSKDNLQEIQHRKNPDQYYYIPSEDEARKYLDDIRGQNFAVSDLAKRESKRNPLPPFITSTLQQEASKKFRFSASRTMVLAQKLYEGMEIGGDGLVGLITYMRTDSTRLGADSVAAARAFIAGSYGKEYVPKHPFVYKKKKTSQDAHEAIRPTSIKYTPSSIKKYLDKDLYRLYELIWNRFIASQMEAARLETTTVTVTGGRYLFRASASVYTFRGFLLVYDESAEADAPGEEEDSEMIDEKLPQGMTARDPLSLGSLVHHRHETSPPPRYAESSLVKTLEALGIGRPSTYAMIVGTIIDRKYVEQRERKLYALALGLEVNKLLAGSFPHIFNVRFTARMEEELDTIASGKNEYRKVLDDFFIPFKESLDKASGNAAAIKKSLQTITGEACELCGRKMVNKWGRNGRFMACTGYPKCKNTMPLPEDREKTQHHSGQKCDLCEGEMLVRSSKFGTFLGCSNYPKCRNTKPITTGIKCPKCPTGEIIEKKTKRRRSFYGCSKYPECDFASWDKPTATACETCGSPFMVEKYSQKRGEYLRCPSCKSEVEKEESVAV